MKSIIVLFLILCNGLVYCQDQGIELPDGVGFFIYKVPDKHRIIKMLNDCEKYSPNELTKTSRWAYHITVSSCKLYLDMDSSFYHFNEAYKIEPFHTCSSMRTRHNYFIKTLEKGNESGVEDAYIKQIKKETGDSIFSWYLWDLPDFDEFAFIDSCNLKYPEKKAEPIIRDSTLNSEIIGRRDQKYRSLGNLEAQQELDRVNRNFIDSLYLLKGSLNDFNEDEIFQISMVTHHSEDCDWAYKWMERLIEHYNDGYRGKSVLGPLLERMLARDGYCTNQDAQKRDYFIYMIKDKYPYFFEKNKLSW